MTDPVGLKEYFDKLLCERQRETHARLEALQAQITAAQLAGDKASDLALSTMEKAVNKAEASVERRFEGVNEFRKTLSDQTATFLPRVEYTARHDALINSINENTSKITLLLPRTEFDNRHETLIARITALEKFRAEVGGRSDTVSTAGTLLYSIVIAGAAIIGVVVTLFFKGH